MGINMERRNEVGIVNVLRKGDTARGGARVRRDKRRINYLKATLAKRATRTAGQPVGGRWDRMVATSLRVVWLVLNCIGVPSVSFDADLVQAC
jgi:uncharacterized membrane protein